MVGGAGLVGATATGAGAKAAGARAVEQAAKPNTSGTTTRRRNMDADLFISLEISLSADRSSAQ